MKDAPTERTNTYLKHGLYIIFYLVDINNGNGHQCYRLFHSPYQLKAARAGDVVAREREFGHGN